MVWVRKFDTLHKDVIFLTKFLGSGKSAICLGTYLFCFARGLPVVYIPMADRWVEEAMNEDKANKYLMKEFFKQNADIIAGDSRLSPFFEDQLNDQPTRE
jgi:hypothetical protein